MDKVRCVRGKTCTGWLAAFSVAARKRCRGTQGMFSGLAPLLRCGYLIIGFLLVPTPFFLVRNQQIIPVLSNTDEGGDDGGLSKTVV